jgi:hypothetical protein
VRQSKVLEAIRNGEAEIRWVALAEGLEVMARPARVGDLLVGVSARRCRKGSPNSVHPVLGVG